MFFYYFYKNYLSLRNRLQNMKKGPRVKGGQGKYLMR